MALLTPSPTNLKMKTKNQLLIQQQFLYNRTTDFTKEPSDMIQELIDSLPYCNITVLAQSQVETVFRITMRDDESRAVDIRFTKEGISNPEFVRRTINRTIETYQ